MSAKIFNIYTLAERKGFEPTNIGVKVQRLNNLTISLQYGVPNGIRTRITTVKGWCPNH